MYQPRPVAEVTTEDLIATIAADRDHVATFEARIAFTDRTGAHWGAYAPEAPRTTVRADGCGPIHWHNFVESGLL
jgi:hypothetical protein